MKRIAKSATAALSPLGSLLHGVAQPTVFTYQGRLSDQGNPATGAFDLALALYDAPADGNAIGLPMTVSPVTVDFGVAACSGTDRWLELSARPAGSGLAPSNLQPHQPIASTPCAIRTRTSSASRTTRIDCRQHSGRGDWFASFRRATGNRAAKGGIVCTGQPVEVGMAEACGPMEKLTPSLLAAHHSAHSAPR